MKILALDLGDKWTGSAISDGLRLTARPYESITADQIVPFIKKTLAQEYIDTIVVGYPKTMSGTESEQTKKIIAQKEELEKLFPSVQWILWDERLSSKRAASIKQTKNKKDKLLSHSIAAASILQTYLHFLDFSKN